MDFIKQLFSETNGTPSSLRISFITWEIAILIAFIAVIGYTIYSHIQNSTTPFSPSSSLTWIAALFTANRAAKVGQKALEDNVPPDKLP
jgi:hypothetical protein